MLTTISKVVGTGLLIVLGFVGFVARAVAADPVKVSMVTSLGEVVLAIDVQHAPISAANFLALVDGKHYDGATFYRSVTLQNDRGLPKIEVIQGGLDPAESPLPPIAHETTKQTGLTHIDGAISLARGDVGTASSEFFICIGAQPGLDFGAGRNPDKQGFAVFGRVVAGMPVIIAIHGQPADGPSDSDYTAGQILTEPVQIISMRRID
jgi:peptidyl-prolyl cis-trans isomerase A (cyclophilin A)